MYCRAFATFNSPTYGNCFSFNSQLASDSLSGQRVSSLTGPSFGLSLILNVEQGHYMPNGLSEQAGAVVAVHDPGVVPLMDEYGHNLDVNSLTTLTLQEVKN